MKWWYSLILILISKYYNIASRVENVFEGHYGPILDIKRSPFFPTVILSVGGKSFRIWKEGITVSSNNKKNWWWFNNKNININKPN